jgi:ferritin-like metal-binding protein YciE
MEANTQQTENSTLQEFFVTALQELYWSETHLVEVLTTMTGAATTPQLKEAFQVHKDETEVQKQRLEQVFAVLALPPQAEPSAGLQGLFDEGWQVIDETQEGTAQRDVALIIAAQKVEHYEIACYGSLITLARTLGQREIAEILRPSLEEEKQTDTILTTIAESGINADASQEPATMQNE